MSCRVVIASGVLVLFAGCSAAPATSSATTVFRSPAPPVTFATANRSAPLQMTTPAPAWSVPASDASSSSVEPARTFDTRQSDPPAMQTDDLAGVTAITSATSLNPAESVDRGNPVAVAADFAMLYWTRSAGDSQSNNWATRTARLCTAHLVQQLADQQLRAPRRPATGARTAHVDQAAPRAYPKPAQDRLTIAVSVTVVQAGGISDRDPAVMTLTTNIVVQRQQDQRWLVDALINQPN